MTHDDIDIIGKNVKDMYGTFMGKVVGTITDIDGSIQSVGIDCGSQGLQQIQYEQLVVTKRCCYFHSKMETRLSKTHSRKTTNSTSSKSSD